MGAGTGVGIQVLENLANGCDPFYNLNWKQIAIATTTGGATGGVGAWVRAANSADDVVRLTAAQQKSIRSLQRQIEEHLRKLDAYRRDPDAYDNLGHLERAPSPEIRQRIIDTRIRHLEREIRNFQDQIEKVFGGG